MITVPRLVTVAAGVFAPGHLGELTRYLPFELVDDVLAMTGAVQKRMRVLPSRVGMYFVLALALFPRDRVPAGLGQADLRAGGSGPAPAGGEVAAGPAPPAWPGCGEGAVRHRRGPARAAGNPGRLLPGAAHCGVRRPELGQAAR